MSEKSPASVGFTPTPDEVRAGRVGLRGWWLRGTPFSLEESLKINLDWRREGATPRDDAPKGSKPA